MEDGRKEYRIPMPGTLFKQKEFGVWGRGLLQSDADYDIADDLQDNFGCKIFKPEKADEAEVITKLNGGLLALKFDEILSAKEGKSSKRKPIILLLLAMLLGVKIEDRHMAACRALRSSLPNMFQQLQLVTALDEYKNNGTRWVNGSKGLYDTMSSAGRPHKFDNGDEFWFGALGHSADEDPFPHTYSKKCLKCQEGGDNARLLRCSRCNMARYWNQTCQQCDWADHKKVCKKFAPRSVGVPDKNSKEKKDPDPKPKSMKNPTVLTKVAPDGSILVGLAFERV